MQRRHFRALLAVMLWAVTVSVLSCVCEVHTLMAAFLDAQTCHKVKLQ